MVIYHFRRSGHYRGSGHYKWTDHPKGGGGSLKKGMYTGPELVPISEKFTIIGNVGYPFLQKITATRKPNKIDFNEIISASGNIGIPLSHNFFATGKSAKKINELFKANGLIKISEIDEILKTNGNVLELKYLRPRLINFTETIKVSGETIDLNKLIDIVEECN